MKYPIKFYFIRLLSFFIPKPILIQRLEKIEGHAKEIAQKKNIPFLVSCKIIEEHERKPDSFTSIGFSYQYEQMNEGKYCIFIYHHYAMDSEQELLKTIFHEYGHFIDYCTSVQTKNPLIALYDSNKFPGNWYGTYREDFAELFAWYMLDLIAIDDVISRNMDSIIQEGISNLSDGEMKKSIDFALI